MVSLLTVVKAYRSPARAAFGRNAEPGTWRAQLLIVGLVGAALLYVNGAVTPAVSLLMAITTLLAALVAIQWGYSPFIVVAVNGFFFVIDAIFFAANSVKLFEGGWFPLLLAGIVAFMMLTWRSGVRLVEAARGKLRQPEEDLIETAINKCHARLSGTAVFLRRAARTDAIRQNTITSCTSAWCW